MISGDRSLASGKRGAFAEMLQEFSKHWERIDILCPRHKFQIPNTNFQLPSNVFIHSSPHGLWYQPFWIRKKGQELMIEHHHDVMTVHEYPPFYNGIGARMLKQIKKIPAVLEIHHIVGWPEAASWSELWGRILSRLFLGSHASHFEAVRVVNATVKSLLMSWGVQFERVTLVPSVYLNFRYLSVVKNRPKIFDCTFCSRFVENKGLLETIEAMSLLPNATLQIIGDGPLREKASALIRSLGLGSRVHITGWVGDSQDVFIAIALGHLFIMNSKSEGNPRVAIEAMACGVPVLATRVGIMPDVIIDGVNGVFTDGTAKDIAAKARVLLADLATLEKMGTEAAQIAHRFEKTVIIKKYADFLKSLVHSRS